jgi:hypothetical protein
MRESIKKMFIGPETKKMFESLDAEIINLFYRWKLFRQLFDGGEKNINLLNRSGANVFALLRRLILDDVYLTLCRLTDPATTVGFDNLSLRFFLNKLKADVNVLTALALESEFAELKKLTKHIRMHRSKRLAHSDLKVTQKAYSLPPVLRGELDDALHALAKLMEDLHMIVFKRTTTYMEGPSISGPDGRYLLKVLTKGLATKSPL